MYPPKGNQYPPDQSSMPTYENQYPPDQSSMPTYPPTGNQYYPPVQPSAPPYPPPTGNQYHAPEQSSAQAYPPSGSQFYPPKQSSAQTYPTPTDQYYPSVQPPAPPPATGIPVHPAGEFYPTAAPGVQVTSTVQFYPTAAGPPGQFYPTAAPPGQFYTPAGPAGFRTQQRGQAGWSTGLFDCFDDVGNSIITLFLPCVTFGQIAEILDRGNNSCVTSTVLYTLILYFFGCPCVYSCTYRSKLRAQYSLEESPCSDFIVHCCLEQCALCQEYRELKNRGFDMNIGYRANMERQGHGAIVQPPIQVGMYR